MSYGFGQLNEYAYRAHKNSVEHGFWNGQSPEDVTVLLSKLALITSEVGEAVEAVRKKDTDNLAEELADICIRVFDLATACQINIEQEIVNKMDRNSRRPRMHGKLA